LCRDRATPGGMNKSDEIRKVLAASPKATPSELMAALAKRGVKVSKGLVNQVKYKKRGTHKKIAYGDSLQQLLAAKSYIKNCGGVEQAKRALLILEKLVAE